jgi:hypothetical protein
VGAAPPEPSPLPVHTGHASVFYLLNLMPQDLGWPELTGFARHLLRGRPRARRRARDPIWPLLRDLSGLDRLPPPRRRAWWRPALTWLGEHDLDATKFEQPGRILVTATHVDVVLGLEQIDLAVRISGLDQDPGWLPRLGRIVAVHFEDPR